MKKHIFKLKLYIQSPKLLFLKNHSFTSTSTPVLLLSMPRSGSSWIGSILGQSNNVRYLREPATTSYTLSKPNRISVFDQLSCEDWSIYKSYLDMAFSSKPNFTSGVIPFPKQWLSPENDKKLVIKEVNPLLIPYYQTIPAVLIYLIRHPFSIFKSYQALKWKPKDVLSRKVAPKTLEQILCQNPKILQQGLDYQMGYLQGWVEGFVKSTLRNSNNHSQVKVVRYEDVCKDPQQEFRTLYSFAGISFLNSDIDNIKASLAGKNSVSPGSFSLTRQASSLIKIIIKKEEQQQYINVMKGYQKAINDYLALNTDNKEEISASYINDKQLVDI
ncbi:sulfotransferase domain-containing protein [Colwellia sp. RSH04]|uniref:sulfotransferase domain-containing protein n=1 Tax=Colwellia sp. RSH04 TaxID=2305464 RepID=UPI0015FB5989|nr:sulfotransferase domain-containing protein [Colwellia sp. RSH04]